MSQRSRKSLATARQSLYLALLIGFMAGPARSAVAAGIAPSPSECGVEPGGVCVGGGRFHLAIDWFAEPLAEAAEARTLGRDAVYFRSPGGAGLVVQVVDGRAVNGHFWVLSAALAHPSYSLEVTDLATGERRRYSELDDAGATSDLMALPAGGREPAERGRLRVAARIFGGADFVAGELLAPETAILRAAGSRDPELVVSLLDGRDVDGQWWVLSTSPAGQGWDLVLADPDSGERRHLRHAAATADTQLLGTAPAGATSVAVTLDAPRAVRATIAVTGGTLSAQSANGTKFTLTIPAKALLSPQEITLTPIKSIQRLPFKPGLVGGVEIGPAGLRLAATASLRIAPTQPVALAQETTFGYRARGAQFFLYPALLVGKPVVLPLIHAGGYGLARGTAAEQAKQLTSLPPRAEDQFDQKLWNLHAQRRRLLKSGAEASSIGGIVAAAGGVDLPAFYKDIYRNSLRKLLTDIAESCEGRKKWGSYAENFIAKAVADGVASSLTAETAALRAALNLGTAACYNEAGKACLVEKESKAVIPMLVYWRQLESAGMTRLVDAGKLESCLTFEFEFDTVLDHDAHNPPPAWNNGAHHRIDTKIPVRWRPPFDFGTGLPGTPNNYIEARWTAARQQGIPPIACTFAETGKVKPSNLSVHEMFFLGVNSFEESPPPPRIELAYSPGAPAMEIVQTCPPGGPVKHFLELFPYAFVALHGLEVDPELLLPPVFIYLVKDWTVRQGGLYALKTYAGPGGFGSLTASEVTNLYVFHKPGN